MAAGSAPGRGSRSLHLAMHTWEYGAADNQGDSCRLGSTRGVGNEVFFGEASSFHSEEPRLEKFSALSLLKARKDGSGNTTLFLKKYET